MRLIDGVCPRGFAIRTSASTGDRGTMMRGDPSGFGIASSPAEWPSTVVMSFPVGGSSVYSLGNLLCFNWCPIHWFKSLNAGIGCLGIFFHRILLFSKTGVTALVSSSLLCRSPVVVFAAGDALVWAIPCSRYWKGFRYTIFVLI